jgi:hypothetical protein
MANSNWVARAQHFLDSDIARLKAAKTDIELRVAMMDSHAVLESALRGYMTDILRVTGALDKSKTSFRTVVELLRDETGDSIIDSEMSEALVTFNSLRNHVVHEAYQPSYQDVQSGLNLTANIINRLFDDSEPLPSWQIPFHSVAKHLGGDLTYSLSVMMIIFSILYIINPIDIPGPLDDVGITAPCIFSAAMLINAARVIKRKSR